MFVIHHSYYYNFVQNILDTCGLSDVWNNKLIDSKETLINIVDQTFPRRAKDEKASSTEGWRSRYDVCIVG